MERLISNDDYHDSMEGFIKRFVEAAISAQDIEQDGQVRRVLKRFALAALAGELATKFDVTGCKSGAALNGTQEIARTWISERDVTRASVVL
ncbi:hypothetical protein [Oceaniglobus indicus]|uniref:hypothetical protein n=1 Tax=Oceaniglobus indicus TaxID=2047749 RepID=UPI000C196819|nr:hypothetical protein [Oceaniglobus indicus]